VRLALATLAALSAPAAAATCVGSLCDPTALQSFFARLESAGEGTRDAAPVHILQIGDSHTAGDAVTGAWRDLLQARFGAGGRGVLPPGRPYDGYITRGVTASMSPGWAIGATFGKGTGASRPLLGLSGFSLTAMRDGATMALTATPAMAFDRFVLCAIAGPDAGGVTVRFDGAGSERLNFTAPSPRPICRTVRSPTVHLSVEIGVERRALTITSWATFRDGGGVVLSNLGVVGSQLAHFARTDDAVVAEELEAYRPDLIVLAFGTNEGFAPHFDPVAFEAMLRSQVTRLRLLSGDVPMLLLGAPDSLSRQAALRTNAPGAPVECEAAGSGPALFAPPALTAVRAIQRRVAAEMGLAFWDWQAGMGGRCAARNWVQRETPLMRGDYVHFNKAGGLEIAGRLQADLDRGAAHAE